MVKVYVEAARIEQLRCGKPNDGTVRNTLAGVRHFRRWLNERRERLGYQYIGFDEDFPNVSIIKPRLIHRYLSDMLSWNIKPITALSYLTQFQQLFARWVRPYYEDHGWKVPSFPAFGKRPKCQRYIRPSREQLLRVKNWYEGLTDDMRFNARRTIISGKEIWFVATMMLEFAMRNSDIVRLKMSNFCECGEKTYLCYTPHKTQNSSGRVVKWPVHIKILNRLKNQCGQIVLPEIGYDTFEALNAQMRALGFNGTKGAYELRKICIDHVYQRFGAEMATSISGDDIKTIMRYYADPAQPNIGNLRITDLL